MGMKLLFTAIVLLKAIPIYACSDILLSYPVECIIQDKFQTLDDEYQKKSIDFNHLIGNYYSFAISDRIYNKNQKNIIESLSNPQVKNNILAMLKIESTIKRNPGPFLTVEDLNRFHAIFSIYNNSPGTFDISNDRFRTTSGITNPRNKINCEDNYSKKDLENNTRFYDLETIDGYLLIDIQNINKCTNETYQSGEVVFYKGPSIKYEMNRWLVEFNDTILRYKNYQTIDVSPYEYLADMHRWFLAIHPYQNFNENVAKAILIWASINLEIPLPQINDEVSPFLKTKIQNRSQSLEKINDELIFLSSCLNDYNNLNVSAKCTELNL